MASVFLSQNSDVSKSVLFTWIKVLLSSVYTILCTVAIDYYYKHKAYKTYSGRLHSKFYFFNFYCLTNNIVAEFYGVMSAGIKNMDKQENKEILEVYSTYIFTSCVKVGISLIISPYVQKFMDYIWKWANMIKFKIRNRNWPINYNKVITDIPIEHNLDMMATFVVQCMFTIGFFQPFMIPCLSLFFTMSLVLFYLVEKRSLTKWQSVRLGTSFNRVKVIYTVSFVGFLFIQGMSFGNMKLVLGYFKSADSDSFKNLLGSFVDYTTLFICLIISFVFTWRFRHKNMVMRLLDKLVKYQEEQEKIPQSLVLSGVNNGGKDVPKKKKTQKVKKSKINGSSFSESVYFLRNPYVKLSSGYFDIEENVENRKEQIETILKTGEGILQ